MHYNYVEKPLSAHRFDHSAFARRKIINKFFTILFRDTLYLTFLKVNNPVRYWSQLFQKFTVTVKRCFIEILLRGETVSTTAVKILEMYLYGVYLNSFEKSFLSKIF